MLTIQVSISSKYGSIDEMKELWRKSTNVNGQTYRALFHLVSSLQHQSGRDISGCEQTAMTDEINDPQLSVLSGTNWPSHAARTRVNATARTRVNATEVRREYTSMFAVFFFG